MTTPRRTVTLLAVTGFLAAALVAVAGGRAYTGTSTPPTRWWGLIAPHGNLAGSSPLWSILLWVGITALSGSWVAAVLVARRGGVTERQGWTLAALWALPLTLGPPAVSKDIYAYAAQGILLHHGADVYRDGPSALASVPGADAARALAAVDPRWRESPSPYGPAATAVQWLAGASGNPVTALVVLRIVAVLAVAALAWCCVRVAAPERRPLALVLVALNPVLLVHGLSAAHVDALMCALLVASLVAARRGVWWAALALAVVAGLVKAPALLAVPALLAWHALDASDARQRWRRIGGDLGAAIIVLAALSVAVPDGWGWLRNLSTPGRGDPTSSITGHLAAFGATSVITALGALAAVAILIWLARTFTRRDPIESLGWALLAIAFLAPVTYPWYALWGLVCLLPLVRGRALVVLVGLCVIEAGFSIPGAANSVTGPLLLAVMATTIAACVVAWRRAPRSADGPSREATLAGSR